MIPGANLFCRELMCLAQGHNTAPPVGIEPRTSLLLRRRASREYKLVMCVGEFSVGDG